MDLLYFLSGGNTMTYSWEIQPVNVHLMKYLNTWSHITCVVLIHFGWWVLG